MKDSNWPTNSRCVKFLSFWSFGNLLTSFCIGIAVSGLMLLLKAKEFSEDCEFKASLSWYQKWKRCHSVSLRSKTTLHSASPTRFGAATVKFHWFVITFRQHHGYSLSRIFHIDDTPMWFKLPSSCTLEFSGNRTVSVNSVVLRNKASDLQECSHSQRPCCSTISESVVPQKAMDGWSR